MNDDRQTSQSFDNWYGKQLKMTSTVIYYTAINGQHTVHLHPYPGQLSLCQLVGAAMSFHWLVLILHKHYSSVCAHVYAHPATQLLATARGSSRLSAEELGSKGTNKNKLKNVVAMHYPNEKI